MSASILVVRNIVRTLSKFKALFGIMGIILVAHRDHGNMKDLFCTKLQYKICGNLSILQIKCSLFQSEKGMDSSPDHNASRSPQEQQGFQSSNGFQLNTSQQHAPTSEMSLSSSTAQHNGREHGNNSDRKRNRRTMSDDSALDDILGQSKFSPLILRF